GTMTQTSLANYEEQFDAIKPGKFVSFKVRDIPVNLHLFDSTVTGGDFAYGEVRDEALGAKLLNDKELDIAVLHHHFIQPPQHKRECDTELYNCAEVASHMLSTGYDAVLFGHTHKSYLEFLTTTYITKIVQKARRIPRLWRRFLPKNYLTTLLLKKLDKNSCPVSYSRATCKNGNYPSVEHYFKYLYLKNYERMDVKGPTDFRSAVLFHRYLDAITTANPVRQGVARLRDKRTLISMAPSACQAEADRHGIHEVDFMFDNNRLKKVIGRIYEHGGSGFALTKEIPYDVPQDNKSRI
ncbi:MAG: hypothetical protein MN733_22780, partial [Nitrososphaera sp.]|nr:hypothetical protein [Nitrososphaera sp.]